MLTEIWRTDRLYGIILRATTESSCAKKGGKATTRVDQATDLVSTSVFVFDKQPATFCPSRRRESTSAACLHLRAAPAAAAP